MSDLSTLIGQREQLQHLLEKTLAELGGLVTPYGEATKAKIREEIVRCDERIAEERKKDRNA